jgi:hypothetical protein
VRLAAYQRGYDEARGEFISTWLFVIIMFLGDGNNLN